MLKSLLVAGLALGAAGYSAAQAVIPGYLTDPTAMKEMLGKEAGYITPENLRFPYISTYYVKPTVTPEESVKIGFFVTDFDSSKIRFLDDAHRFTAFLEYRLRGGASKVLTLEGLKSGDAEFNLGKLPAGDYEMRIWAKDAKGRESHRVIHDFRVMTASDLAIPVDKVYTVTHADLAAYGIRNDGDFEKIVFVETNGTAKVMKEKRAGVPGYTVTVSMDEKTGKLPAQAFKKAKVVFDEGYDKTLVETNAVLTRAGLQKLIDDKAAAGFRKVVMLPGTYRISHVAAIEIPDGMTLDLGKATLKQNAFTGDKSLMVNLPSARDAHLVNGTLEGDYWTHDYAKSPNNSEWCSGFQIGGDSWYCSVENVKVTDITGYGGQNGIAADRKGWLTFFYENLPAFSPGGLDAKTGEVDETDTFRFTTDFKDLKKVLDKGARRLQISKLLGYQGCATRSWQMTVAWYDAEKKFISAETAWQYREMWIQDGAAFLRVSVEDESAEAAGKANLVVTAMRLPVNCAVKNCTFDRCRCVGYAASAMKNMLFEGNFFTRSGESAACCAFDAEDGWDQMQDVYFLKNVFRDNPRNNSILTCAGHNFILEKNDGDIYLWGRTHSPCVRGNAIGSATFWCDSRLRSGYGRLDGNAYAKGVILGLNESKPRPDNWDYVLSGLKFDGEANAFNIEVGPAGRLVDCSFRNMPVSIANAYACTFENCTDGSTYKAYPSGRWLDVTVKDSSFSRFFGNYNWEHCHFFNARLTGFNFGGCTFAATKCDFTDSTIFGLSGGTLAMNGCAFNATVVEGNYWEKPATLAFTNCTVTTRGDSALVKIGVYNIGDISFDGCAVSGRGALVNVKDLRPQNAPDPAKNTDLQPGAITFRNTRWTSEAKTVVAHAPATGDWLSKKKITIDGNGNAWPEGVEVATDLPAAWKVK